MTPCEQEKGRHRKNVTVLKPKAEFKQSGSGAHTRGCSIICETLLRPQQTLRTPALTCFPVILGGAEH